MHTVLPAATDQRVILANVSWETFMALVRETESPRGRFAYDQGLLEILSPSGTHERLKKFICRMIEILSLELGIDIASYGATTLLRTSKRRGLEPDECYYVQNEPRVRGKGDLDLKVDPPPDLVVEVDLSRDSLDKFQIYASLGVPEIWRLKDAQLRVYRLLADGRYAERQWSAAFPMLSLSVVRGFLARWDTMSETALLREFRSWVTRTLGKA
jgi:Uma2 family endonuclease